jgi:hypothetical protein
MKTLVDFAALAWMIWRFNQKLDAFRISGAVRVEEPVKVVVATRRPPGRAP